VKRTSVLSSDGYYGETYTWEDRKMVSWIWVVAAFLLGAFLMLLALVTFGLMHAAGEADNRAVELFSREPDRG
jgi:RsiW-degrading membrane proteinase PrsW (M82 family)